MSEIFRNGGSCAASLARKGVIEAVERLSDISLVHIAAVVEEKDDAVANLGGSEVRVLALEIAVIPHDLRVADGVGTRRSRLELSQNCSQNCRPARRT